MNLLDVYDNDPKMKRSLFELINKKYNYEKDRKKIIKNHTKWLNGLSDDEKKLPTLRSIAGKVFENQAGSRYIIAHIESGLVSYSDYGIEKPIFLPQTTLSNMRESFVGRPLYFNAETLSHPPDSVTGDDLLRYYGVGVSNEELPEERPSGLIVDTFFDSYSGWEYVDVLVLDTETQTYVDNMLQNGERVFVSNAYTSDLIEEEEGATMHGIDYSYTITDGVYDHLAIVDTPRYENAQFEYRYNSINKKNKGVDIVNIKDILKRKNSDEKENIENKKEDEAKVDDKSSENTLVLSIDNTKVDVGDGNTVPLKDILNAMVSEKEETVEDKKQEPKEEPNKNSINIDGVEYSAEQISNMLKDAKGKTAPTEEQETKVENKIDRVISETVNEDRENQEVINNRGFSAGMEMFANALRQSRGGM